MRAVQEEAAEWPVIVVGRSYIELMAQILTALGDHERLRAIPRFHWSMVMQMSVLVALTEW